MVLKGNLLFNGDFETGDTEGWNSNPFGLSDEHDFFVSSSARYRGDYGGTLLAGVDYANLYLLYDKIFSFEEYEGYLYMCFVNNVNATANALVLYGLDDKGNLNDLHYITYNQETNAWRLYTCIIRGLSKYTHFKVGFWGYSINAGGKFYIDEAKLIPLKSIKSYNLSEYWSFSNVTSTFNKYTTLGGVGEFKLKSIIQVDSVSGSSPTLDIRLIVAQLEDIGVTREYNHSQFTNTGSERIEHIVENVGYINVRYEVGGTDPSFSFRHVIILKPQ